MKNKNIRLQIGICGAILLMVLGLSGCAGMDFDSLKAGAQRMHESNQDRYGNDYAKRAAEQAR